MEPLEIFVLICAGIVTLCAMIGIVCCVYVIRELRKERIVGEPPNFDERIGNVTGRSIFRGRREGSGYQPDPKGAHPGPPPQGGSGVLLEKK